MAPENNIPHSAGAEPSFLTDRVNQHLRAQSAIPEKKISFGATHLNFADPDYLGLSSHPSIIEASIRTFLDTNNNHELRITHQKHAEVHMAEFLQAEAVAFFQSPWNANSLLLQAISEKSIPIYYDTLANLSIREALKSVEASSFVYPRESAQHLESLIQIHGAGIIIIDAISDVDGSIAPLIEIARLSNQYRCLLIVDESHSLGTADQGRGLVSQLRLQHSVHFITAELTKTFCCQTSLIVGSLRNTEYVRYHAKKSHAVSTLLLEESKKIMATLEVIQKDDWRRVKLHSNAHYLRTRLHHSGFTIKMNNSHLVNLFFENVTEAEILYQHLALAGVAVDYQTSPVTAPGTGLIRFIVNARHNKQQMDELVSIIELQF